jgi:hypothetical protein
MGRSCWSGKVTPTSHSDDSVAVGVAVVLKFIRSRLYLYPSAAVLWALLGPCYIGIAIRPAIMVIHKHVHAVSVNVGLT